MTMYLPRTAAAPEGDDVSAPESPARAERRKIVLVVEDDPQVLEVAATMVRELGYQTLEAKGGREALAILDGEREVDVLFTDVVMHGVMGGPELVREARLRRPGLKALLVSGYDDSALGRHGAFRIGAKLLHKPYSKRDLAGKLETILEGASG